MHYIDAQFNKLPKAESYDIKIEAKGNPYGTHWMLVSPEALKKIQTIIREDDNNRELAEYWKGSISGQLGKKKPLNEGKS